MEFIFHFGAQRSKLFLLWIIWLNLPAGKSRECMTSLQISCSDRNIFTRGGIRSTPGGFCGTGHSCCVCAAYCMLFRAHYGTISQAHATPAHQRVATFRLLDVAALEHEFRFPIDLWRKSWTFGGWRQVDFLSRWRSTLVTPIDQQKQQPMS